MAGLALGLGVETVRRAKRVFLLLAVLGLGFLGHYGTRVVYHARVFIELAPGDAVLGSGRVASGAYYLGGGCYSQYARDASGRTYLVVERGRENGVMVFGPDGKLQREIRLKRLRPNNPLGYPQQLGVSPSGRRFWTVNHIRKEDNWAGLVVYCYSEDGKELQHWPAERGGVQYFAATGEVSASLWAGGPNVRTYTFGTNRVLENPFLIEAMWLAPDGWIWSVKPVWDQSGRKAVAVQVWRQKPGQTGSLYCTAAIPISTWPFPFSADSRGSLYAYGLNGSVIRIAREGRAEALLSVKAWIKDAGSAGGEDMGRMLSAQDDGTVYFDTGTPGHKASTYIYRIYKAELIPRWRGWLADLGVY